MPEYRELLAEYDRLPRYLEERAITTKYDLLDQIQIRKADILREISNSSRHTARYRTIMEDLLDRFLLRMRNTVLPRRLEDWWRYSIEITHKGILLCMEHIHSAFVNEDETKYASEVVDQIFPLVFIPAQMLTVDEYAKLYEVEPVTVRQWIRRCKLRAVEKAGKEWRISELADIPRRGFEGVQYRWRAELPDVPEEFSYINSYKLLTLVRTGNDSFTAIFSEANGPNSKIHQQTYTADERERLETFFIGNPLVEYANESISINRKKKTEPDEYEEDTE